MMNFIKLRGMSNDVYINIDKIEGMYRSKIDDEYVTKVYAGGDYSYFVYDSIEEIIDKIMVLKEVRISDGDLINKTSLKENKPND